MKKKIKKTYPMDGKTIFGISTMSINQFASTAIIGSLMLYLTDYSGMGAIAVTFATILLAAGRIFDAVDDPIQALIIDGAKITKSGKYKKFMIFGIIIDAIGIIMLFSMPSFGGNLVLQIIWMSLGYLFYEMGFSMQPIEAIRYTLTSDSNQRMTHVMYVTVIGALITAPLSMVITIIIAIGDSGAINYHDAFFIGVTAVMIVASIIALIGTACVKEGSIIENTDEEKTTFKDIIHMFKTNKPLWMAFLADFVGDSCYVFLSGALSYFMKWAYGAENLASNLSVWVMLNFTVLVAGTFVGSILKKKFEPKTIQIISYSIECISFILIFALYKLNLLTNVLLFVCIGLFFIGNGSALVTCKLINMESTDYALYTTGKNMACSTNALNNIRNKSQSAIATFVVGTVLIGVGYAVNDMGEYIGTIPVDQMLDRLMIVLALIPIILSGIAVFIFTKYPITGQLRKDMYEYIGNLKEEQGKKLNEN